MISRGLAKAGSKYAGGEDPLNRTTARQPDTQAVLGRTRPSTCPFERTTRRATNGKRRTDEYSR